MTETAVRTVRDYRTEEKPKWCPGCGDFAVLSAMYKALAALQVPRHEVVIVSGIGCSSRLPYFVRTYGLHAVHGRALPIAQGVKLGNPNLTVLAVGGDGDFFSIGPGHIPHAAARNVDVTAIVMDNSVYGLTKGQTSPTTPLGYKTKTTPYGSIVRPLQPVLMALAYGASFVARGYSAKPQQVADLIVQGVRHKGFAFIHVMSPCTEFNNTYNYLDAIVEEIPADHDVRDAEAALRLALREEGVHLGVFYAVARPIYEDEERAFVDRPQPFDLGEYMQRYL